MTDDDSSSFDRRHLGAMSILLGNAALFANGLIAYMHSPDPAARKAGAGRMVSGALYSGTGGIIARYGSESVPAQLGRLENKLAAYLQKEGVPLDADQLRKANAETQKNWFGKLENYAYDHPIECANIYNLVASVGMLGSGFIRRSHGERESGNANIANFLMILAGTLTSVLVKEQTPEQIAKKGQAGTMWGKVQEQPLNYAVWPFMAADLSYVSQAHGEYKTAQALAPNDPYRKWALAMPALSAVVMASSLAGDTLTGFSSKKPGGEAQDRSGAQNQLIETAGRILAAQPPATQQMLAEKTASYLATQQSLRMGDFDPKLLASRIMEAVSHYKTAPAQPAIVR